MADRKLEAQLELDLDDFPIQAQIEAGPELVVLFGPSGAGKSITLKTIAGLVHPSRGRIKLGERVLFDSQVGLDLPPQRRKIGYVPQKYALFPHRTVAQNVAYGLHSWPRAARSDRVRELLRLMDLEGLANRKPHQISGGQQQRTALARAIAPKPDLLLMDEPFGALDQALRERLREELRGIQIRLQIPILLVTHNLAEAYRLADQLVVIDQGQVIQAGPRDDVFRRPASPIVARLMGMINILETTVVEKREKHLLLKWKDQQLNVQARGDVSRGDPILLGIRPEEVIISRQPAQGNIATGTNTFQGSLVKDLAQGYDHLLTFTLSPQKEPGAQLMVRIPHPIFQKMALVVGQERYLSIDPADIHIIQRAKG